MITYTYDADGNIIRKQAAATGTTTQVTDYIDGFVYNNAGGSEVLAYFPMPEGRVLNNAGTFKQEFIITDEQGNARISFQDNGSGVAVVKQENSYYGFGMAMLTSPVALPTTPNKQLYNGGSEWQNDYSNLPNYYETFNRNYDPAIGRFVGVDPKAESAESMTGYQYAGNNPIMNNDPMGDLLKVVDPVPYSPGTFGTEAQADVINASGGSDLFEEGFGGIPLLSGGNSNYVTTGTGLSAGQVRFLSAAYNNGKISDNYYLDHSGTYHISDQLAFIMGASYMNRFNAWGTNGFSPSFDAAVYSFDMSSSRKGPAFKLSGETYDFTPPDPSRSGSNFYYNATDADGNSLEINGTSGSGEVPEVTVYGDPKKELDLIGLLDRSGTYTEAIAFLGTNSGAIEFTGEKALSWVGNAVGVFVLADDLNKSLKDLNRGIGVKARGN